MTSPGSGSPNRLLYEAFIGSAVPPPSPVAPSAPTLTATGGTGTVSLSWISPGTGTPPFTYTIYKGTASGQETTMLATGLSVTSYIDNSVTNGTTYWYQVTATNSVSEGPRSSEKSATPQAAAPPGAPTLTASQPFFLFKGVQLSWTTPASSTQITQYKIYRSTSPGTEVLYAVGSGTSVRDTGTTRGVRYYYRVSAVNAGGEGPLSNEASAIAR